MTTDGEGPRTTARKLRKYACTRADAKPIRTNLHACAYECFIRTHACTYSVDPKLGSSFGGRWQKNPLQFPWGLPGVSLVLVAMRSLGGPWLGLRVPLQGNAVCARKNQAPRDLHVFPLCGERAPPVSPPPGSTVLNKCFAVVSSRVRFTTKACFGTGAPRAKQVRPP